MEKYLYEEKKDYIATDIRRFFEGLGLSRLNKADLSKIKMLKDVWTEFYFRFVIPYIFGDTDSFIDETAVPKISEIFVLSDSVENENTKKLLLDYAYDYVANFNENDIFTKSAEEDIDKMLNETGLLTIDKYFEVKKQIELLNNQKK